MGVPLSAKGNLAEADGQLDNMVEHPNPSQPNPGLSANESPCMYIINSPKVDTTDFDELFARGHARSEQLEKSASFEQNQNNQPLSFDMDAAARRFPEDDNEDGEVGTPFEIFSKEAAFKQSRKGAGIGYEEKVQSFLHDQQQQVRDWEYQGGSATTTAAGPASQQQSVVPGRPGQQQSVPGRPGATQDQSGDRGRQGQRHQQEQLPFGGQGLSTGAADTGRAQSKPRYKPKQGGPTRFYTGNGSILAV